MSDVLIVDEDPAVRSQIRSVLDGRGWRVAEADSGAAAVDMLDRRRFALVVADMLIADIDAADLIGQAKRCHPDARVVATAAEHPSMPARWALKVAEMYGADRTLYKPLRDEELLAAIEELLSDD